MQACLKLICGLTQEIDRSFACSRGAVKASLPKAIYRRMNWFTQVKNHSSAKFAENFIRDQVDLESMRGHILERNHLSATYVRRDLLKKEILKLTWESIQGRNHSDASFLGVAGSSQLKVIWQITEGSILTKDHSSAQFVGVALWGQALWKCIWRDTKTTSLRWATNKTKSRKSRKWTPSNFKILSSKNFSDQYLRMISTKTKYFKENHSQRKKRAAITATSVFRLNLSRTPKSRIHLAKR